MKYIDINKRYSEIVAEYISKGYTINTASMSGSQGEIAKIDLTDGNEIIRISVSTFVEYRRVTEGYEIIVGRYTEGETKPHNSDRMYSTIWNSKPEIIYSERFYKIDRYGDFLGTEEEAIHANAVRSERYNNRKDVTPTPAPSKKAIEIAKRIIRRKFGYNRINTSEVKIFKGESGYIVSYHGKRYILH